MYSLLKSYGIYRLNSLYNFNSLNSSNRFYNLLQIHILMTFVAG